MFSNLQSLNQAQTALAKRLIERMSSLIIDKECFETLIELVDYKIKQKLTPTQSKLMKKPKQSGYKKIQGRDPDSFKLDSETISDITESNSSEEEDETLENFDEKISDIHADEKYHALLKHIDDDGEKGLKLLSLVLSVHSNYGFANLKNYTCLLSCINSPKEHIVSNVLKLLATHFSWEVVRSNGNSDKSEIVEHKKVNENHLAKLKLLCKNGKPKQAKHAVYLIHNCLEKPNNEHILEEIYKTLVTEIERKENKNLITCIVSLGHICLLEPKLVGKEIKDFLLKSIIKDIIMQQSNSSVNVASETAISSQIVAKRQNNLKLAGKWCEDEEEIPFETRVKVLI